MYQQQKRYNTAMDHERLSFTRTLFLLIHSLLLLSHE